MNGTGANGRKRTVRLKAKLIAAFVVIVCVMGFISIFTFVTLRLSLTTFDGMVEVVILANEISALAGTPTVGMPKDIERYSIYPTPENEKNVRDPIAALKAVAARLKSYVKNPDSAASLLGLQNMIASTEENFGLIKQKLEEKAPFSEVNDITNQVKDTSLYISDGIRELISLEANYDKTVKGILDRRANTLGIAVIVAVLLVSAVSIVAAFIFSGNIVRPLVDVADTLKGIAEGEGDLTTRLAVVRNDEIGLLSNHFNAFLAAQNRIISQIKDVTGKTRDIGSDLASSSEESATALEEISRNMESMKNKINYLDGEISKSNRLADEVKGFITRLDSLMGSQSSAVDESSAEIQGMLSSIRALAASSEAKLDSSVKLNETARVGEKMMADTIGIIKKVTDSTSIIMDLVKVIANTNRQTNILAMNASIEAAHAGGYGRGFAVVANAIRSLAESTEKSSKGISKSMRDLVRFMQVSRESIEKTGSIFTDIVTGVSDFSAGMVEMKGAMEELSLGSGKIIDSLKALVKVTDEVRNSYASVNGNIQSISKSLEQINLISNETKTGMIEVTQGVGELYTTAKLVSDTGVRNVENISELGELVEKFKVEEKTPEPTGAQS